MKKLLLILIIPIFGFAQGVQFIKGTVKEAFEAAKQQNKPLLLEIYSPTCHVCQSFMPIFESREAGSLVNPLFVAYRIDVNSTEFAAFEKVQKIFVPSLPLLMFYDANGKFIHHGVLGENQGVPEIRNAAFNALDSGKRSSIYKSAFAKGNREENFLIEYALLNRIQRDTTQNIATTAALYNSFNKSELGSRMSWLILYKLVLDVDNGFFKHWIKNPNAANDFSGGTQRDVLENVIFSSLYSNRGAKYSAEKIGQVKGYLSDLGRTMTEINRMTLLPEAKALMKEGKTLRAIQNVETYLKTTIPTASELSFLVGHFNNYSSTTDYASFAQKLLEKGVALNKGHKDLADLHYESARLNLKISKKEAARKASKMALSEAIKGKVVLAKYEKLWEELK